MGVQYRNFLLARDENFVAGSHHIAEVVRRLRSGHWVATPGSPLFAEAWADSFRHSTGGWAEPFVQNVSSRKDRWEKAVPIPLAASAAWFESLRDTKNPNAQADELALRFAVNSGDESFDDLELPYALAYGGDEPGYHDVYVYAARDFVIVRTQEADDIDVRCTCGAALSYEVAPSTLAPIDFPKRVRAVCLACAKPLDTLSPQLRDGQTVLFRFALVVDCEEGWPVVRRVGEPEGIRNAMAFALGNGVAPRENGTPRRSEDTPTSPEFDGSVLRSAYGDPAPPIAPALIEILEGCLGRGVVSVPDFY